MKKYSKKLLGVLLVSAMAATGITAVPGTNVYAAETQETAEKPVVESVKIDKQGQTLYFDEFDGSDERGFKISVKVSNCTDRFIWVGVNSKNCSYNFMGAEHNDSTGTYDLTVSNIGVYDGDYFGSDTGKYWISKIAFGDTPDEAAEVELSKGSNKYEAKNADEALYWVNISDQYKMTFYEPDLSVKEIRNDSDYKHKIFKQTKTAYVKEGTTEADLKNVYTPSEKAGLTFKGWYAPYASPLFTLKEDGSFKSGATIVPQYDKKVVPFSVMFTEPDSKGNYGEVVDIQKVNSTSDVKFPTVKGYESYEWQGYADEMGTDYCIKVNGKKPETALSLVSSGVIGSPTDEARSGLYHDGSEWNYYKEGIKDTSYTGLCKYNGSWWYVKNGKVDFGATTLCKYNGAWFYVKGGKVDFSATTLCKYNGSWFYVKGGKVDFSTTTLCKYNGAWFYVKGGKVDFNATTLCKYNGTWWYVKGGKIDFKSTTLCKYNGTWFYVNGGKVNFGANGLCKYNGVWWYIKNGSVSFTNTLCKFNGTWWYINNGAVNFNKTTLVKYGNNWYAVAGGKVAWGYTGNLKYNGGTYRVVNGVVKF